MAPQRMYPNDFGGTMRFAFTVCMRVDHYQQIAIIFGTYSQGLMIPPPILVLLFRAKFNFEFYFQIPAEHDIPSASAAL